MLQGRTSDEFPPEIHGADPACLARALNHCPYRIGRYPERERRAEHPLRANHADLDARTVGHHGHQGDESFHGEVHVANGVTRLAENLRQAEVRGFPESQQALARPVAEASDQLVVTGVHAVRSRTFPSGATNAAVSVRQRTSHQQRNRAQRADALRRARPR